MLQFRKVTMEDMDLLYHWANDETVRKNSFCTDKIEYRDHLKWFKAKYNDENCIIFIIMNNAIPVGQIRLDINGTEAYIDYSIQKEYRNKGIGSVVLKLLEDEVIKLHNYIILVGWVKKDNISSYNIFVKLGYQIKEQPDYYEFRKVIRK